MSSNRKFPARMRHVQKNDPVTASTASGPDKTLEARTNYLKDRVDEIEAGRALIWNDQTVAVTVLEGQPVYWNSTNLQWELALAGVEDCVDANTLAATAASNCKGVVLRKKSGGVADIVLWGVVKFTDQLANSIDDSPIVPGEYYLSSVTAGKLTAQKPAVTINVMCVLGPLDDCDENTWVDVRPMAKDFLEKHIHHSYDLVARPAGEVTPPEASECHIIAAADATLQGWLPADNAAFNGFAPTGAKFGYNLAAHEALDKNWAPVPTCAAVLEMLYKGDAGLMRVPPELVVIDKNGIWWMTDCYNQVPWPTDLDTTLSSSSVSSESLSSSSSSAGDACAAACPTETPMQLVLSFIKMTFLAQKNVVTSLQPDTDQPLAFVNCDGAIANTGELFARLLLSLLVTDEFLGGQALKGVTADNKFERGWVTEGLIAGSNITLTSTHNRLQDPTLPASESNPVVHQELVTVNSGLSPLDQELNPQIVTLGDAVERTYKGLQYIGLKNGRDSGVRLKFIIPPSGLPAVPKFKLRLQLFGRANGTLTDLDTAYKISVRPDGVATPTPIVDVDVPFTLVTNIAVTLDEISEIESEEIDIAAGDTIYVSIDRLTTGTPVYSAEIGLHRFGGVIVDGS